MSGVKVTAYNNTTSEIVAETYTEEDGTFNFSDLPEGEYTIKYKYGDTNDTSNVPLALKYNGYDYITSEVNGNDYTVISNVTRTEIEHSGKGAIQFMIVLDCSTSARTIEVEMGSGETKRRLDVEIDATRKLINNLLNCGENIYIGLVAFSGDAYRAASLTKDETYLNEVLDYIQTHDDPLSANTYMIDALNKAEDSFYNTGANSNTAIVFISDGIPTKGLNVSREVVQVYKDDSDEVVLETLQMVKESTIERLVEIANSNTKLMCLIVKSDDAEEQAWADSIFGSDSGIYYVVKQDGDELASSIILDIPEWIESISVFGEDDSKTYIVKGYEDVDRRVAVDGKFIKIKSYNFTDYFEFTNSDTGEEMIAIKRGIVIKTFNKKNVILDGENKKIYVYSDDSNDFYYAFMNPIDIKNISGNNIASQLNSMEIIDPLNEATIYGELTLNDLYNLIYDNLRIIEDLGEALYMTAECGVFHIDSPTFPSLPNSYYYGGNFYELNGATIVTTESYKQGTYIKYTVDEETGEVEFDDTYTLTLRYEIASHTGVNLGVTQRPNFTLATNITATNMRVTLSTNDVLSYKEREMGSEQMLFECIDSEIAQGTTVEVEYTMTVQNNSPYTCHHLELVAHLPSELIYSENAKLLSNSQISNSDIGWTYTTGESLYGAGKISLSNYNTYSNRTTLTLVKDSSIDGFSLAPNEIFEVHVLGSRFLSSEDIVSFETDANVEVLGYRNNGFRRGMDLITNPTSIIDTAIGIFPGNTYVDTLMNLKKEIDFAECTNKVAIVPPTGGLPRKASLILYFIKLIH
ncbi:MAG: VWA domain-containing protein [Clostridia bacterium]|nr:VWA domain-containing protein [Clostridia bacterium]